MEFFFDERFCWVLFVFFFNYAGKSSVHLTAIRLVSAC